MAQAGDEIENTVTGERIVFRRTAAQTNGELLELDSFWTRPGHRTPEHVHPEMEERWQVLAGVAGFRVGGVEQMAGAGDVVVAASGIPHIGWNAGEEQVHVRIELRPALRWEEFVVKLFSLAREGRTDETGMPEPALLAKLGREFSREIAPPPPPLEN